MPAQVDSNSPAYWSSGQFHLVNSTGNGPMTSDGADQFHLGPAHSTSIRRINPWPTWIEAAWVDPRGVVFAWYHQEHFGVCPGTNFSVPQIGAALSYDGGESFYDMGAVIASGDGIDCSSRNGYFAGGNGDVSVILDGNQEYFYFFFTNYAGPLETQGIVVARMPFASRFGPVGAVMKYYQGTWSQPGLKGRTTPIYPATVSWQQANSDSFWGPSIHWNTYLQQYVMLLNRSCCSSGFPQQAIYAAFGGADLSNPASWSKPQRILQNMGWYPQVIGHGENGGDTVAGRVARLYIYGHSYWEIVFEKPKETTPDPPQQ
jgi:hypothetical protein